MAGGLAASADTAGVLRFDSNCVDDASAVESLSVLPGASPEALIAARWDAALLDADVHQRHGLVTTLPHHGDVEKGCEYEACCLQQQPMVTWYPPGDHTDRFCLLVAARSVAAEPRTTAVWLVVDIPGGDVDSGAPSCRGGKAEYRYGFAGNFDATERGKVVLPFEGVPVDDDSSVLVLLFKQVPLASDGVAALAPRVKTLRRENFDVAEFSTAYCLGAAVAADIIAIAASRPSAAPGYVCAANAADPTGHGDEPVAATSAAHGGASATSRPLAYSCGGELVIDADAPSTLTAALWQTAETYPEKGLTIYDVAGVPRRLPYSELRSFVGRLALGLGSSNGGALAPGDAALLQVPSLAEHFGMFWACLLHHVRPVAVAIPPNYADGTNAVCLKIRNVWQLLDSPPLVTSAANSAKVELLRNSVGMGPALRLLTVEALLDVGAALFVSDAKHLRKVHAMANSVEPSEVAFYQLSSGSTGVPKCIQIAHRGVVAHIHGEAKFCGYGPADVHFSFLPVDHVVPILTVHCCDVYHGCEEVQADVAWIVSEPLRWLRLLSKHEVTRTWAPNFAFKLVADALKRTGPQAAADDPEEIFDLSKCRYWMNAGEQVTIPVCVEFLEQTSRFGVKRSAMQPSFGMAEACTCMTYNNEFDFLPASRLDRSTFVNLGPPVPGVEIRIADELDQPVPEEVVGRFQIRGAVITPGYLKNDEANKDAFVGDDWFNTGDVGFIKHGRLYLTGREKEMIIIRGANFYCYEVEDVVNVLSSATPTFSAAVSAHDPTTGTEGLAIFFVPSSLPPEQKDVQQILNDSVLDAVKEVRVELTKRIGLKPSFVVPLVRSEFPKTTSGKIQRSGLAKALRAGDFDARLV